MFLTLACTATVEQKSANQLPSWFYTPSGDGYIGGVGVCATHVKGATAQRELAISRALEDIARQYGVKVDSVMKVQSKESQISTKVDIDTFSLHTFEGKVVIAKIIEVWKNEKTDELYIYMRSVE